MADALGLKAEQRFEYPPLNVATPLRYSRVSRRYFANWASCEAINASYHNFACSALEVEALRLINTLFKSKFYCFNYVSEWAPEAVTNWQNNLFLSAHTHTSNTHTHSSPTGYVLPTQSNHLARTHTHTLSITHTHSSRGHIKIQDAKQTICGKRNKPVWYEKDMSRGGREGGRYVWGDFSKTI